MKIAWVIGSSGLLGAALCRSLRANGTVLYIQPERFNWDNEKKLIVQISEAIQKFASSVSEVERWEIYWAAGVGTMSSFEDVFVPEARTLSFLLSHLKKEPRLMSKSGAIAFASSAGAIYAGSKDDVITENSVPAPTTAYARAKLSQEELVRSFATTTNRTTVLIARISTLYGSGQAAGKQQGLLSYIARSIPRNQPIRIYVPYDTIRDYIAADDAANMIVNTLNVACKNIDIVTKIIASEKPVTIAEIISIFKRISRRKPRVVTSANALSYLYTRRLLFKSIVIPIGNEMRYKSLSVGIAELMSSELKNFVMSSFVDERLKCVR